MKRPAELLLMTVRSGTFLTFLRARVREPDPEADAVVRLCVPAVRLDDLLGCLLAEDMCDLLPFRSNSH